MTCQVLRGDLSVAREPALSDERFYALYHWCLNPILSLRDLFQRLREEIDRYERVQAGWQREECRINLYLFVCAIACTVDDHLARRPLTWPRSPGHSPPVHRAASALLEALDAADSLRRLFFDRPLARWRRHWDRCVDGACELLVDASGPGTPRWVSLRATLLDLSARHLPARVLTQRMRVPEGFRCQDLTHHDVLTLARRFSISQEDRELPIAVVGARTAGAYFAPLVKAYLSVHGWPRVSWLTVRPRVGLSRWERRELRSLGREAARVLVVDDYPNTGFTLRLMLEALARSGVEARRVVILTPRHPARPDWTLPDEAEGAGDLTVITLEPAELHKAGLLSPRSMESLLRECREDCADVRVHVDDGVEAINARLWRRYEDGFHVRLKRVFELGPGRGGSEPAARRLLAKSVGWGWLGYHAYLIGTRLAGHVPRVIGLREGLLLTEWLDGAPPGHAAAVGSRMVETVSSYVAARARRVCLAEDPCFGNPGYRWTGWDEIVHILCGVYGLHVGHLKKRAVRRHLARYLSPVPTVVDGRMRPEEWIETASGIYKVDFEHHNFGGAELDLVDPAYDLASAMCELSLSEEEARRMLEAYARSSGDRTAGERVLLYELLYGLLAMRRAAEAGAGEARCDRRDEWNRRYLHARDYLVYRMSRFQAGLGGKPPAARWSKRLVFLDVDGVLDCQALGFPHTTPSGLAALDLLRAHDWSVVLNTGRSVEHVRHYCRSYGVPGGLAEHGSVFVDAVRDRELGFTDGAGAEQLARCRQALGARPGVCIDPGYRHSIRAYRYRNGGTAGLERAEVEGLMARCGSDRLTFILRAPDTCIVQKGNGKGPGASRVRRYLDCADEPIAAIGDSEQDIEILKMADVAYATANCARGVRELARGGHCRLMRHSFQRGLLAAAGALVSGRLGSRQALLEAGRAAGERDELIWALLCAAERPRHQRWLAALDWRGL